MDTRLIARDSYRGGPAGERRYSCLLGLVPADGRSVFDALISPAAARDDRRLSAWTPAPTQPCPISPPDCARSNNVNLVGYFPKIGLYNSQLLRT